MYELPETIYYFEASDAPEEEKVEIAGLLKKLPIKISQKPTVIISAIHYQENNELKVVEGREEIVSKLNELLSRVE